jgi:hypothetical protein
VERGKGIHDASPDVVADMGKSRVDYERVCSDNSRLCRVSYCYVMSILMSIAIYPALR